MAISQGQMEILRDFWNTEHHRLTKYEQIKKIIPVPIHIDAELELHYRIEKLLQEFNNNDS
jgi:hypothetical protein